MDLGRSLLWVVFGALVVAGGWMFLDACALSGVVGLDYCPIPADHHALIAAVQDGDALGRQVHMAELAIAEKPVCAPPAATTPPVRPAPVTPIIVPPLQSTPMDQKVIDRGGHNGVLQFTLEWESLDDLDLNVDCPGGRIDGRIDHKGPGICGDGRKDIDANRLLTQNVSNTPVENIVWQSDIPKGRYVIEVIEYQSVSSQGNRIPFTLRIRSGTEEKVCHSFVTTLPLSEKRMDGSAVVGGTYQTLTLTYDEPLPDCPFESQLSHRGAHK